MPGPNRLAFASLSGFVYSLTLSSVTIFFCRHCRLVGSSGLRVTLRFFPLIRFVEALGVSLVTFASRTSFALVGSSGLEPPTSCLSGTRSNLLSYEPVFPFRIRSAFYHRPRWRLFPESSSCFPFFSATTLAVPVFFFRSYTSL